MNNISTIDAITQLLFIPDRIPDAADVCIVLGNDYVDTMKMAKFVYDNGISDKFILTGHSARKDKEPECDRFFRRGMELGIPPEKMLLENKATNSYQNLQFSGEIIRDQLGGFENCRKILFIAKAFVTRRIEMTAKKLYPEFVQTFFCSTFDDTETGKNIKMENWWKNDAAKKRVLEELARIAEYTLKGDLEL